MNEGYNTAPQSQFTNLKYPKDHIPIRSVIYKKTVQETKSELPEIMQKQSAMILTSTSAYKSLPPTHRDAHTANTITTNNNTQSQFHVTLHRLGMTRKESDRSINPKIPNNNNNSPKLLKSFRSTNSLLKKSNINSLRQIDVASNDVFYDDDAFDQLKSRRPFTVQFQEEKDQFYTEEFFNKKISTNLLTNTDKFLLRSKIDKTLEIPEENVIQEEYKLRFPVLVSTLENENTLAAHVLAQMRPNFKFIEMNIDEMLKDIENSKQEENDIKKQMEELVKKHEEELESINTEFKTKFNNMEDFVKEDFISNQNENFRLQKEIALLKRDKLNLEDEIEKLLNKIKDSENQFYGVEMYDFIANDKDLEMISTKNLREEFQSTMSNRKIIH